MGAGEIEWSFMEEGITREQIADVESIWGVKFPDDYVACVLKYAGGYADRNVYEFEGHKGMAFRLLLSPDPQSPVYMVQRRNWIQDRLADHVYPFANDDFGNYMCFDYRRGTDPTIVFWDHEEAFMDKEKGLFPICSTFTEFLSKLYKSED